MKISFVQLECFRNFGFKKVGAWTLVTSIALFVLGKETTSFSAPLETGEDTQSVKQILADYNSGVLPWVVSIDPDKLRLYKESLDRVRENISSYCLASTIDLTSLNLVTNVKTKLSKMILGTAKTGSVCQSMFFEPVF